MKNRSTVLELTGPDSEGCFRFHEYMGNACVIVGDEDEDNHNTPVLWLGIDGECLCFTQEQIKALMPLFQKFVDTGKVELP